jgi:hypothetical protein
MSAANPVSPKLWTAAVGAGAGATVSTLLIWLIGAGVFNAGWTSERVNDAIAAVPFPLAGFILLLVTLAGTMLGAYLKADPLRLPTLRPDLARTHMAVGSPYKEGRRGSRVNPETGALE